MPRHHGATILSFAGQVPRIHESAFVAPGARIIGDVEIGPEASVWYNCVLRGDIGRIAIGARSNLQDGTVVHVEPHLPAQIGEGVLVGHMAILHGCVLEDRAFVGMGAVVMDGCRIGSGGMLAAGALLSPGKHLPAGELWAGRPAKPMRPLKPEEVTGVDRGVAHYVENARRHAVAVREVSA